MTSPSEPSLTSDELLAHAEFLRALARRLLSDEASADDLVQETWVRALRRPPEARGRRLARWLARVLANLVKDRAAAESARRNRERAYAELFEARQPLEYTAGVDYLGRALRALPTRYRSVLYLRYYADLTPVEVAAHLAIPEATAKTRLRRALSLLRQDVRRRTEADGGDVVHALLPIAFTPRSPAAMGGGGVSLVACAAVLVTATSAFAWWSAPRFRGDARVSIARTDEISRVSAVHESRRATGIDDSAHRTPVDHDNVCAVAGRVRYDETGDPVPFYEFRIRGRDASETVRTGRDGSFESTRAFGSRVAVTLPDEHGIATVEQDFVLEAHAGVARIPVKASLGPTYFVDVHVPAGYRAADFSTELVTRRENGAETSRASLFDDGTLWTRFSAPDAPIEAHGRLVLESNDGIWRGTTTVARTTGLCSGVARVLLDQHAVIGGVVRDATGGTVAGVSVGLQTLAGTLAGRSTSDHHGRFEFPYRSPGAYVLYAADDRFRAWDRVLRVARGESAICDIHLNPVDAAANIVGRVHSMSGQFRSRTMVSGVGVDGATTRLTEVRWHEQSGRWIGSFDLGHIDLTKRRVSCETIEGFEIRERSVRGEPERVGLEFVVADDEPVDVLDIRVVDASNGRAIEDYTLALRFAHGHSFRFDAAEVARGDVRVGCSAAFEWFVVADGYRIASGAREHLGVLRPTTVELARGYGTMLKLVSHDAGILAPQYISGGSIHADGVPVATSDAFGNVYVSMSTTPVELTIQDPLWRRSRVLADSSPSLALWILDRVR